MSELVHRLHHLTWAGVAGLATFVVASGLDLLYHTAPAAWTPVLEQYLGPDGSVAHLITFVGMILILIAVLSRARTPSQS